MGNVADVTIRLNQQGQREVVTAMGGVERSLGGVRTGVLSLSRVLPMLAFGALASDVLNTSREFQRLHTQLETVTGSAKAGAQAFDLLRDFAAHTPFQLTEVVTAFAKLKAQGLDPSEAALRSYGNTAAGMGKSLDQMVEAVADAAVGEFERLKEFGIKARSQGDQVTFTFKGVSTTVKKESEDIQNYLRRIGEIDFAGGMERQMSNLDGAMSNLSDSWDNLMATIGDSQTAIDVVNGLSGSLTNFSNALRLVDVYREDGISFFEWLTANPEDAKRIVNQFNGIDLQLLKLENRVKEIKENRLSPSYILRPNEWESDLQAAIDAVDYYKMAIGDVDRLKSAAQHNVFHDEGPLVKTPSREEQAAADAAAKNSFELRMFLMEQENARREEMENATMARLRREKEERDQLEQASFENRMAKMEAENAAREEQENATMARLKRIKSEEEQAAKVVGNEWTSAAQIMSDGFSGAMADMVMGADISFKTILDSFTRMILQMMIKQAIVRPLMGALGFTMSANGNVFSGGRLVPFAAGTVVSQPTFFPMAGGDTGLMGEAGPEAIMPLTRIGGKLGVVAEVKGGGGMTVHQTIQVDARGADAGVETRIRQAVAEATRQGYQMVLDDFRRRGPARGELGV